MPSLFWTGKLSLPMRLLVDANNLLALFTGASRDTDEDEGSGETRLRRRIL